MMSPPVSPIMQSLPHHENRTARTIPTQLLEHATGALEEGLFADALTVLSSVVTSGTGSDCVEALLPTHQHLALAETLAVHPSLTTSTTQSEKQIAANDALRYLKHVLKLVGPAAAGYDAFRFKDQSTSSARGGRTRRQAEVINEDPGGINSNFAHKDSLRANADDFWSVVGWAFNCSSMCRPRWERWKLWLEFMLDVLETDLEILMKKNETGKDGLEECLLSQYLAATKESASRNSRRRVIRAIFADGSPASLASFPEIFKNETRPPKKKSNERVSKRKAIDLENGEFGDYDNSASNSDSSTSRSKRPRPSKTSPSLPLPTSPSHSLPLRHRFLSLLSSLCLVSPASFCSHADLSALLTEILRPAPLDEFTPFLLPSTPYLTPFASANLLQTLIRPILSAHAPTYSDEAPLIQVVVEKHYAPFKANGLKATDHAKVAVCVEAMLRLLWRDKEGEGLVWRAQLEEAVSQGVKARRNAIEEAERGKSGRSAGSGGVGEARMVAEGCAERMMAMLEMSKSGSGK